MQSNGDLCGAQRKDDPRPCHNPRSECTRHCGANAKNGKRCPARPMPNGKCRMHSGKALTGVAHPNFRHGGRSKYVYDRLQAAYEENLKDQQILELVDEISVLRAMIQEQMEKGESSRAWKDATKAYKPVKRAYAKLTRSIRSQDAAAMREALNELDAAHDELDEVLKEGAQDARVREEIKDDFERVRKLVDTEHKHRIDHRMVLTQEQVVNHVAAVVGVLTKHVKDRRVLNAINADLRALDAEPPFSDN